MLASLHLVFLTLLFVNGDVTTVAASTMLAVLNAFDAVLLIPFRLVLFEVTLN